MLKKGNPPKPDTLRAYLDKFLISFKCRYNSNFLAHIVLMDQFTMPPMDRTGGAVMWRKPGGIVVYTDKPDITEWLAAQGDSVVSVWSNPKQPWPKTELNFDMTHITARGKSHPIEKELSKQNRKILFEDLTQAMAKGMKFKEYCNQFEISTETIRNIRKDHCPKYKQALEDAKNLMETLDNS